MLSNSSGSSLSPPQNPSKRLNDLDASFSDAILPEITSPSASEVIDTNFQQIIIDVLVSDCRVKLALENIVDNAVTNAVKKVSEKYEERICYMQGMLDSLNNQVDTLKDEIINLNQRISKSEEKEDQQEQYLRRNSLRIINPWPEERLEDTDGMVVKMAKDFLNVDRNRTLIGHTVLVHQMQIDHLDLSL